MPVAALTTLGCKVNQYETEKIAEDFARAGFALGDFDAPADVYVINSCSVTASADKKSRYLARKASRTNPDALVVMTGCHAQLAIDLQEIVDGATLLVPNHEKMDVFGHVARFRPDVLASAYSSSPASDTANMARFGGRTRATLKIQDGCEHFCGFCSIPYTRKVLDSRDWRSVVAEAQELADTGTKEIVVTGVCVGAYNEATGSGGPDLAEILLRVADVPGIARVRLSSVQPIEVTDAVIDAFASHPNLCPHLHLSCQSGDDSVLAAMRRPYSTDFYKGRVARLREKVENVAITTDLIVGYPGETEAMHKNTLEFARSVGFQRTHVFRYSPRPRTHAETLPDDVSAEEKVRRHRELQALVNQTNHDFSARYVGETLPVLIEGRHGSDQTATGHTTNYIKVSFAAPRELVGEIVPVRITHLTGDAGEAVGQIALSPDAIAHRVALAPRQKVEFVPLVMAAGE